MGDEHTIIPVFFAGVFFQALLVSRSMAGAIGTSVLGGLSLAAAWGITRDEPDRIWSLPFLGTLIFVLAFACFYRDQILPRISSGLLLHYSLLTVYSAFVWWHDAVPSPWLLASLAIPALVALYAGIKKTRPGRFLKLACYVWFLVLLTVLIGQQFSMTELKSLYDEQGFSLALHGYVFVGGMVFLFFASNLIYLLLLIPIGDRRGFWDAVLGSGEEAAREHRDALASKMTDGKLSLIGGGLLLVHAAVLAANFHFGLVAPGLLVNATIAITAFAPGGATRESPARES